MTDKIEKQIELWFYRDISDDQRKALIRLTMGEGCADEADNHSRQRFCLKHILAAHRLAGERAGMLRAAEWQPIETAPQDGTEVLLYYPQQGVWAEHWAVNSFQRFEGRGWDMGRIPTHWQPLSAPPIDATLSASSQCPICGRNTPHHHPLKGSQDA